MPEQQLYIEGLEAISEPSFYPIKQLASARLRAKGLLVDNLVEPELFSSLERGTAILESEDQVDAYTHAFGSKHYNKFMLLFQKLPADVLSSTYDIIDWACGGGVSIISAFDFLKRQGFALQHLRQITLIEPSACALQRAKLHAEHLFSRTFVRTVHKRFEKLDECDFEGKVGVPRIHLFSNILDLNIFDDSLFVQRFCNLLKAVAFRNDETFICVSPAYRSCLKARFNSFIDRIVDQERWLSTPICEMSNANPSMYAIMARVQNAKLIDIYSERSAFIDSGIDIFSLAAANDYVSLNALVQTGAEADAEDNDGWPLIVIAAKYGAVDVVKVLLHSGADPDRTNREGATALYFAAKYNQIEIAQELLEHHADVNICTSKSRRSALFMAVQGDFVELASLLIQAKAQIDQQDAWAQTPLYCAVAGGCHEMISRLLRAGADPNTQTSKGSSPIAYARASGDSELIRLLTTTNIK